MAMRASGAVFAGIGPKPGPTLRDRDVLATLKLYGIHSVTADALASIQRQIAREPQHDKALAALAEGLRSYVSGKAGQGTVVVDQRVIEDVVAESTRNEEDIQEESLSIVSSFDMPRYAYDTARKTYHCLGRKFPLHAPASSKATLFSERLALTQARLLRHPMFAPPIAGSTRRDYVALTPIEALHAAAPGAEVNVLGFLTQPEDGLWCLEDGQKSVALSLAGAARLPGYFTEMAVVVLSGRYDPDATTTEGPGAAAEHGEGAGAAAGGAAGGALGRGGRVAAGSDGEAEAEHPHFSPHLGRPDPAGHGARSLPLVEGRLPGVLTVSLITHPPAEERARTLQAMGIVDPFGVITTPAEHARARQLEALADGDGGGEAAAEEEGAGRVGGDAPQRGWSVGRGLDRSASASLLRSSSAAAAAAGGGGGAAVSEMALDEADYDGATGASSGSGSSRPRSFLFLSDVHLDVPAVLEGLSRLLGGYVAAGAIPALIVLMGDFCSHPFGQHAGDRDGYRARFDALADLLAGFPELVGNTAIVLVPGPNDPGTCGALPRPPIPAFFASKLLRGAAAATAAAAAGGGGGGPSLPSVTLMSNPCRIRFFTQELFVFRCDLTTRLRRRAILSPSPASMAPELHTLHTIAQQGHLSPLPLTVQPLFWQHDHALRLHPLPDVLVLGEARPPYSHEHAGMQLLNPGSFARDSAFTFYRPGPRAADVRCRVFQDEGEEGDE